MGLSPWLIVFEDVIEAVDRRAEVFVIFIGVGSKEKITITSSITAMFILNIVIAYTLLVSWWRREIRFSFVNRGRLIIGSHHNIKLCLKYGEEEEVISFFGEVMLLAYHAGTVVTNVNVGDGNSRRRFLFTTYNAFCGF